VIVVSSNPPEGPDRPHGSSEPSGEQGPTDPYGTSQPGQGRYGQGDAGHGQYGQGQPSPGQYPQYGQPQYGQQGQYYPSAPGYYGGPPVNDRDNSYGVVALVTGIIALLMCQPLGVVSIIFGRKAQQAQAAGTANNGTLGTVGFWLGVASLVLLALVVVLFVVLFAVGVITWGSYSEGIRFE
jgi:hypothetical protein